MNNYFVVFLGAGLGGVARYWGSGVVQKWLPAYFPFGTLAVNVVGSFIIGLTMYYLHSNELNSPETRIFITTGFCGGLTTFSTFSFETMNLLHDNEYALAGANVFANVAATLFAVFLAYKLSRLLSGV